MIGEEKRHTSATFEKLLRVWGIEDFEFLACGTHVAVLNKSTGNLLLQRLDWEGKKLGANSQGPQSLCIPGVQHLIGFGSEGHIYWLDEKGSMRKTGSVMLSLFPKDLTYRSSRPSC